MNWFLRLIKTSTNREKDEHSSLFLRWVATQPEIEYSKMTTTIDSLFIFLMRVLSRFRPRNESPQATKFADPSWRELCFSDGAFFEIGCYLLFIVDIWFFYNRRPLRDHTCSSLLDKFAVVFAEVLSMMPQNVESLCSQRLLLFAQIRQDLLDRNVDSGAKIVKSQVDRLIDIIAHLRGDPIPRSYALGRPLRRMGFLDMVYLEIAITSWYAGFLPVITMALETYADQRETA